jgi:hypothetical protein
MGQMLRGKVECGWEEETILRVLEEQEELVRALELRRESTVPFLRTIWRIFERESSLGLGLEQGLRLELEQVLELEQGLGLE